MALTVYFGALFGLRCEWAFSNALDFPDVTGLSVVVADVQSTAIWLITWCILVVIVVERIVDVGLRWQSEADEYLGRAHSGQVDAEALSEEVGNQVARDREVRQSFHNELDRVEQALDKVTAAVLENNHSSSD